MPAYAETIRNALERRDHRRASVCARHGRGRCGRSRACTRARQSADRLRERPVAQTVEPERGSQFVPVPWDQPAGHITAADLVQLDLGAMEQARQTLTRTVGDLADALAGIRAQQQSVDYDFYDHLGGLDYGQPRIEQRHIPERAYVRSQVSVEMLSQSHDLLARLIEDMFRRLVAVIVTQYVPELVGITRIRVLRGPRFDPIDLSEVPPMPPEPIEIEADAQGGRQIHMETWGGIRVDQELMTPTWAVTLSTSSATTITWTTPGSITTQNGTTVLMSGGGTGGTGGYWHTPHYAMTIGGGGIYMRPQHRAPIPVIEQRTPEQLAQAQRIAAEHAEQRRLADERSRAALVERDRLQRAAMERAETLLRSLLSPEQIHEWQCEEMITVRGSEGNMFELSTEHYDGNVRWVDETGVRGTMCAHPTAYDGMGHLPRPDVIAGQILALTTDERAFVGIANLFSGYKPDYERRAA